MVEIPSAALLAHRMLEVVDFLSIGTNDLTQYTMAADRMATDLAHLTDPWQPAVLQLIAITAEAGRQAGKPVGVCGEAAADPLLACALVGMGVTSLSMARRRRPRRSGAQLAQGHAWTPARTPPRPRWPRSTRPRARRARRRRRGRSASDASHRRAGASGGGATVTGTPLSAALPLTSRRSGSVRSLIETPGTVDGVRHPDAVAAGGRSRAGGRPRPGIMSSVAATSIVDRADPGGDPAPGRRRRARGRRGRRGASAAGAGAGPGSAARSCASRSCSPAGAGARSAAAAVGRARSRRRRGGPGRRARASGARRIRLSGVCSAAGQPAGLQRAEVDALGLGAQPGQR